MTCHDAEETILDELFGAADLATRTALAVHVMECAHCRSLAMVFREAWEAVGALEIPEPNAAVVQRTRQGVMQAIGGARRAPSFYRSFITRIHRMSSRTRQVTQGLVAAAVGALLTFIVVGRPLQSAVPDPRPQFMLLVMDNLSGPAPTPVELQQLIAEHRAWAQRLQADGRLVAAEKLTDDDGRGLPASTPSPASTVRPTERIGGFYIIRASDYDEAARIAGEGPIMKNGGRVQVRKIDKA